MSKAIRRDSFYGNTKSLIDLCDSITDCHHSTPKWTNEGKLVIRNFNIKNGKLQLNDLSYTDDENFEERIRRKRPQAGDLIITREAPMGEVCIIPEALECCLGQRMVLIKPDKNKINGKYLLYALQSEFVQIQIQKSDKTGSIVSNLRIPVLEELRIPVFGTFVENKIGSIMDSIDSKIELNNRINAKLEAMAKTLYDYWFVQFDFPNEEGKPYKTSGGAMVWNEELKREVPEGWEVKNLGEIINIFDSKRIPLSKSEREKKVGNIPYYGATSIMGYIDEYIFDDEYILVAEDGSVMDENGLPIVQFIWGKTWVNNHAHVIQASNKENNEYIYNLVKTISVVQIMSGSIQLKINQENLKNVKVCVPCDLILEKFASIAKVTRKQIINTIEENQKLSSLRDWLLPMLMNGQVKVGE